MTPGAAHPAGAISVRLATRAGRVDAVELRSSRPTDIARRLFAGRPVDYLMTTLPMVFSVCATAQACAAVQAVEAVSGSPADPAHTNARSLLVAAETAREHLFRILLGWSDGLGVAPVAAGLGALGRMRIAWQRALYPDGDAFLPGGGRLQPDRSALLGLADEVEGLAAVAIGEPAQAWLARWRSITDLQPLLQWVAHGDAIAVRLLRTFATGDEAARGRCRVEPLPEIEAAALAARLAAIDGDAFVAAPQWDGACFETGALARRRGNPLVAVSASEYGNGLLTRLLARVVELAETLAQMRALIDVLAAAGPGASGGAVSGVGIARVEAARGQLAHWLRLEDGRVADYRILAPTEWNFHPQGALALGLQTLPADDRLVQRARLLVDAIDPCVESHIEVFDDA